MATRVLHVFGALNTGGAESWLMHVYRNIDRKKLQFDFVVHAKQKGYYEDEIVSLGGYVFHSAPKYRIYNFISYYRWWNKFFSMHKYDLLHIHTSNSCAPILIAAKKNKVSNRIVHGHSSGQTNALRKLVVFFNRFFIQKYSTHGFSVSDLVSSFLFRDPVPFIKNGVDTTQFQFDPGIRIQMRQSLQLTDEIVIGHVGRFSYPKNHIFLLEIFAKLYKQNPKYRLFLLGEGELRPQIQVKIQQLQLNDKVYLAGVRKDVENWYSVFDVFVLPSHYEGLPCVAIEAQAAGLPTLLSDRITKQAAVLSESVTYLPIDQGARIWVEAIVNAPTTIEGRSMAAKKVKDAGFDIGDTATELQRFYEELT